MAKRPKNDHTESVVAVKGFDADWACQGFRYELGQSYRHDGPVVRCTEGGFHAVEGHPLEVFAYYPPATSRYAEVVLSGSVDRSGEDSKIAAAEIFIKAEIHLPDLIQRAVEWVFSRAKWQDGPTASGRWGAATASGRWGAATASGRWGAATASGYQGAATASGYQGKARAAEGGALFLVERDNRGEIVHVWAGIAGQNGIKPMVFYRLRNGQPEEAASC